MAMKKEHGYALGAVAGLGLLYLAFRKKKQPAFITSGGTLDAYAGQMFQVRLKRGQYVMMGGAGLTLVSQVDVGDMTDLQLLVDDASLPFTVTPTFIDENDDTNQHTVTVNVAANQ